MQEKNLESSPSLSLRPARVAAAVAHAALSIFHLAIETPSDVADIFVNWAPHSDTLEVSAYRGGWRIGNHPEFMAVVSCSGSGSMTASGRMTTAADALERLTAFIYGGRKTL